MCQRQHDRPLQRIGTFRASQRPAKTSEIIGTIPPFLFLLEFWFNDTHRNIALGVQIDQSGLPAALTSKPASRQESWGGGGCRSEHSWFLPIAAVAPFHALRRWNQSIRFLVRLIEQAANDPDDQRSVRFSTLGVGNHQSAVVLSLVRLIQAIVELGNQFCRVNS